MLDNRAVGHTSWQIHCFDHWTVMNRRADNRTERPAAVCRKCATPVIAIVYSLETNSQ